LQEENNTPYVRVGKRTEGALNYRPYLKGPMSLPRPPLPAPRDSTSDDKTKSLNQKTQSVEEKLDDLSAYIMAKGLYKKCGEKMAQGIQMCKVYPVECFAGSVV
jgi:hypothetical protein